MQWSFSFPKRSPIIHINISDSNSKCITKSEQYYIAHTLTTLLSENCGREINFLEQTIGSLD